MKKMHLYFLFIILYLSLTSHALANETRALTAEQQELSDSLVGEAVEHYSASRFDKAIELFEQAFEIQKEPELLYNIARSHERLAHAEEAVEWYQRFLEMPGTTGELRTRALTNIASLRREIAAKKAAQQVTEAETEQATTGDGKGADGSPNDDTTGRVEPRTDTDSGATGEIKTDDKSGRTSSSLRITGWILTGVGAAALVTGGVFGALALESKKDYDSAGYDDDRIAHRDDVERNAKICDIVFFSGAGVAAVGISLLIADAVKRRSSGESAIGSRSGTKNSAPRRAVRILPSLVVGDGSLAGGLVGSF